MQRTSTGRGGYRQHKSAHAALRTLLECGGCACAWVDALCSPESAVSREL